MIPADWKKKIPSDCFASFWMHKKRKTERERAFMSFGKLFSEQLVSEEKRREQKAKVNVNSERKQLRGPEVRAATSESIAARFTAGRGGGAVRSKQMWRPRRARRRGGGVRTCDESRRSPSSVSDREDEQEALPCPHVLFSHGSKLFLSSRVEDWGGLNTHTHTHKSSQITPAQ